MEGRSRLDQLVDWVQLIHSVATPGTTGTSSCSSGDTSSSSAAGTLAPPVLMVGVWSQLSDRPPPTEMEVSRGDGLNWVHGIHGRLAGLGRSGRNQLNFNFMMLFRSDHIS